MFGLDYTSESLQVVMSLGARFVCRYVGYFSGYDLNNIAKQQGKCLYPAEAQNLLANNIDIVSNFEWYALRPSINDAGSSSAAFSAGQWDARVADAIHIGCGGSDTAPIYFSVDYQTDGTDVVDYFQGLASVIGLPRVGAYGGFDCIKFLFDNNLITYGWQTYAWSNGKWDSRAHIHQYSNGNKVVGGTVDFDESVKLDFGGWVSHWAVQKGRGDAMLIQHPTQSMRLDIVYIDTNGELHHRWTINGGMAGLCGDSGTTGNESWGNPGQPFAPLSASGVWDVQGAYLNVVAATLDGTLWAQVRGFSVGVTTPSTWVQISPAQMKPLALPAVSGGEPLAQKIISAVTALG